MAPEQHSHRPTTKQVNKQFKTRHASKSSLKNEQKGKVEAWEKGSRKTPQQQIMNKIERRNRAKQLRQNHAHDREDKASVFAGRDAAPRVIAVVPLCDDVNTEKAIGELTGSVEAEDIDAQSSSIYIPRFKQKVRFLTPARDVIQCLDACRLADFVLFVLSANQEVDELGEELLRTIEAQGVSTVLTGVYGLNNVEPAKKRPDVVKSLKSFITHFFATQEKVHDLGSRQECSNVMRSLCTTMPKGIRWREDRSWMLLEDCRWEGDQAIVTGVVRGRGLKADRLVQIGDWGDLQIEKIVAAPLETRQKKGKKDEMAVDEPQGEQVLAEATEEQDDLAELAPEEATMDDLPAASIAPSDRKAVLLDDHHYFNDDDRDNVPAPKRLPRGTSKYQAAWYLDDVDYSGSDLEDEDEDEDMNVNASVAAGPADGHFEDRMDAETEAGAPSEYPQSEMFDDRAPEDEAEQIEAYRKSRREDAEDDLEFPDEIELHPGVNARERLAKYRGLKSLRTSAWETEEDKPYEPEDYARLLDIADYKAAKNRVVKEALTGGVTPGTRVHVYLRTQDRKSELESLPTPTSLFSLLRHEHKRTVVNVSLTLSSEYPEPIKSKSPMIMQCGPRRLLINPLFSAAGNTPNNVHKFDRYLHPGRPAVATFIGPVTWGSVPCLFFAAPASSSTASNGDAIEDLAQSLHLTSHNQDHHLEMLATGTTLPPSTSRIVAKRIILTGHPYKIHKRVVTVRYMFFNNDDVNYFRALQLWTKRGRSGFIKETLGTHGYFKATFDAKINPLDSVAVSLYKRVWPRQARVWRASVEGRGQQCGDDDEAPQLMEVQ